MRDSPRAPVTLRDLTRFFLPLIFTTELTQISHSIINAVLARQETPKVVLAAFAVAVAIQQSIGSPQWCAPQVCISFIEDKRSLWRLAGFFLLVSVPPGLIMLALALTPAGDFYFGVLLGASAEVIGQAKLATLVLTATLLFVLLRSLTFGLIMVNRRTLLITYSSAVRVASLIGFLVVLPHFMPGAVAGAVALTGCIATEGFFVAWVGRHFYRALPARKGPPATLGEMWLFSWPLMMAHTAENAVGFIINLFLGRLASPDLALAAFGVVNGLVRVVLSPLRNLAQTAQTLVRSREELRTMLRFATRVTLVFAALVAVAFMTPLRRVFLQDVMGLRDELSAYSEPAVMLTVLVALFWGYAATFRGLLSGVRRTKPIGASSALRLTLITGISSATLLVPGSNGAVVGVLAIAGAFVGETALLGWTLLLRRRNPALALFPAEQPAEGPAGR